MIIFGGFGGAALRNGGRCVPPLYGEMIAASTFLPTGSARRRLELATKRANTNSGGNVGVLAARLLRFRHEA